MKISPCLLLFLVSTVLADPPAVPPVTKENVFKISAQMKRATKEPYAVPAAASFACAPPTVTQKPSTGRTYPHATFGMHVYLNALADDALGKKAPTYPVGALIVKEKLNSDGEVIGVGGMIKHAAGFDTDNGDWEYFYADKGGPLTQGKMVTCAQCHSNAREKDFVFAKWLEKK